MHQTSNHLSTAASENADGDLAREALVREATGCQDMAASTSLGLIVRAICTDAQHDAQKFVLRSDTGHHGE
jgi:hypothetical protein